MLPSLQLWRPSEDAVMHTNDNDIWEMDIEEETNSIGSYLV
jgi:hypothetical protein